METEKLISSPYSFTADQKLLVVLMVAIFACAVAGLVSLVFVPDQAAVVIPFVSLIATILSNLAQKPSFPVPATDLEAKAIAAASILDVAGKVADKTSMGGIIAPPNTALIPVPVDNLILAGDVVKVAPLDESQVGNPVINGEQVKIEK